MTKKILTGKVVSDKSNKTIVVMVKRKYSHPFFNKVMTASKKYHAHDESNKFKIGSSACSDGKPYCPETQLRIIT